MTDGSPLSPLVRRALFFGCLVVMFALLVWLGELDEPLRTREAPAGILSLEMAPDAEAAEGIVRSWEKVSIPGGRGPVSGVERARATLRLDLAFLVVYPATFLMAGFWAAGVLRRSGLLRGARLVRLIGWLQPVAGAADLVENLLLFRVLDGSFQLVDGARWAASLKFVLIGAGLLAFLWGAIVREMPRRMVSEERKL